MYILFVPGVANQNGEIVENSMIQTTLSMSFQSIEDVNEIEGTLTVGIFMDVSWQDQYISWNISATPGVPFVYIPQTWVWVPDIVLYNSANDFQESMTDVPLFAQYNYMWQSRPGIITSVCTI